MSETINENGYIWNLMSFADLTIVKINDKDISNYLVDGTTVGWYDVTKGSGNTNANGDMILNVVSTKYRIELVARALDSEEFIDFYSEIMKEPTMDVTFLNPFTGDLKTIRCYRGDRSSKIKMPGKIGFLYEGPTQSLIEL